MFYEAVVRGGAHLPIVVVAIRPEIFEHFGHFENLRVDRLGTYSRVLFHIIGEYFGKV